MESQQPASASRRTGRPWLMIGALAVVLAAIFGPVLFGGHLFPGYYVNLYSYYFFDAQKYLLLTLHQIPNWDPHFFSGFPVVLTLEGFLNPIFLLALTYFPVIPAYHWLTVFFFAANIVSAYAFCRALGISKSGSWIAAWSYGFSGIIIRWTDVIVFTCLFPILPLSFLAILKIYRGSKRWWWIFAGLLTYGWFGGFAELLIYDLIVAGAFSLFLLLSDKPVSLWKFAKDAVGKFLVPVLISVAVVSPWLITISGYISQDSNRAKGISVTDSSGMPMTLSHVVHMFVPRISIFYGGNIPIVHLEDDIDFYLGTVPLLLLLLLPFLWKKIPGKEKYFFLGLLAFGLLMSFDSPVYALFHQLPVLKWFRWHFKWFFITIFPAAVLAGFAFDRVTEWYGFARAKIAMIAGWTIFSIALLGSLLITLNASALKTFIVEKGAAQYAGIAAAQGQELGRSPDYYRWLITQMADSFVHETSLASGSMILTFALWFLALGALSLGFFPKTVSAKNRERALLLATAAGALIWTGWLTGFDRSYLTTEPETAKYLHAQNAYQRLPIGEGPTSTQVPYRLYSYFPEQTVSALQDRYRRSFVDHDLRAHLSREMLGDNINTWFGFDGAENREPLVMQSVLEMNAMVFGRSPTSSMGSLASQLQSFSSEKRARLLGAMNVRYVLTPHELAAPWKRVFTSKTPEDVPVYVYENPFFLPRWYFAKTVVWDSAPERIGETDATWLQRRALDSYDPPATQANPNDTIQLVRYTAGELTLRTQTAAGRWVVFSEAYVPFWRGFVDGKEVGLFKANHAFQALYVPAGTHEVSFRYPGFWQQFRESLAALISR